MQLYKFPCTYVLDFCLRSISVQTLSSSRLLSKNLEIKIYKTIILPVVLYGCETWSLTLKEESRLSVFENRILRRIFGPKRDENGVWTRFQNEEIGINAGNWVDSAQDKDYRRSLVNAALDFRVP